MLAIILAISACSKEAAGPQPPAFPAAPAGSLQIQYPLDETLFPPEIVAPTFVWKDATEGVGKWEVMLRFDGGDEMLRFQTAEPRWRPSETSPRPAGRSPSCSRLPAS